MERRGYPLTVLHEYRMMPRSLMETLDWIAAGDLAALRVRTGTSPERMELVPLAVEVLRELIRIFRPKEIDVSSYGIREGLLYEQMPPRLRARDPLIEAARMAEATSARSPGFGKKLHQFLSPLFKNAPPTGNASSGPPAFSTTRHGAPTPTTAPKCASTTRPAPIWAGSIIPAASSSGWPSSTATRTRALARGSNPCSGC